MLEFIIMIVFFIYIYKKNAVLNNNIIKILEKYGFSNFKTIKDTDIEIWTTSIMNGDNYIFFISKNSIQLSKSSITAFFEFATKNHFHNAIVIPQNSKISPSVQKQILQYSGIIWDNQKIYALLAESNNITNSTEINEKTSFIYPKIPINDNCKIENSFDPIQDGKQTNSLFGNLFKNKIERL